MQICAWAIDDSEVYLHSSKRTREHVLGQQFEPLVKGPGPYTYDRIHLDGADEGSTSHKSWTSDEPVDWVTKAFCDDCNSGWMAAIDDMARPVVEALMAGGPAIELTAEERRAVATWAFKVSLGFDFVTATSVRHSPAVRSAFFHSKQVPAHTAVVAGAVAFDYANALHALRSGDLPLRELGQYRIFSLLLRNVLIQVASSCSGRVAVPPLDLLPLRDPARTILHPARVPTSWPPPTAIPDASHLRAVVSAIAPFPPAEPPPGA